MTSSIFGWDLLYRTVENEIKNNQDVLVCLVHLVLVSSDFKCIGLGESKTLDGTETKSEALPRGWNNTYAIRYVYQGRLYNLKATNLDDGVMFNLVRVDERNVSLLQLNSRSVVSRTGDLEHMIPDYASIVDLIKKQLINKVVVSKKSREMASQTEQERNEAQSSLRYEPPTVPMRNPELSSLYDPIGVGQRDLHPFPTNPFPPIHGIIPPIGGGGMLFQPPRGPTYPAGPNMGIPPGSIPPGARFDPFRPPDVERFPRRPHNPDNDELPPPGYDDMFM